MDAPLDALSGVGEKTKERFESLGVYTVQDLLDFFPRAYEQYTSPVPISTLQEEDTASIEVMLTTSVTTRYLRGRSVSSARCSDGSGELTLSWYNMPYIRNSVRTGTLYIFRGRVRKKGAAWIMDQPSVFLPDQYHDLQTSLQPVYSLTKGIHTRTIQKAVRQAIDAMDLSAEYLPEEILQDYHLMGYREAVEGMHFPKSTNELADARRRLVFDEFFFFLLQLRSMKESRERSDQSFAIRPKGTAASVISSLPYELTGAQKRVWSEIEKDLQGEKVMSRLIQGDVGSGKTILAFLALLTVVENGYQGAMMAPTEVLARQHYESLTRLLKEQNLPYRVDLLVGSLRASQKREVYARMISGETDIIIGTHALIQEKALYKNLALVITDEQHRFGVRQRESLAEKGNTPHTLVMSATPIPRTLAVILYGDLDISALDEMPANRLPIKNCVVGPNYRPTAWKFIEDQVHMGHQAYIICPMVEESDMVDAENVLEYSEMLRGRFPEDICVEALHGRMKADEKNEIMDRFLKNEIQVLVSTTVVEVGVNVPNATVMMIENAERFGLAQLHQLRGRVGRGDQQSYCIFLNTDESQQAKARLDILNHSNDGFEIANKDLELRGPGDLFGVRQSGLMNFRLADIYADADLLQLANEAADEILSRDPDLSEPEHQALKQKYEHLIANSTEHFNI